MSESEDLGLDGVTRTLLSAFAAVLSQDPVALAGPVALGRARALLCLDEQLQAVLAAAVRDVERRELFALADTGSTRSWLRTLPGGEGQHLARSRLLGAHPHVAEAVRTGTVGAAAAAIVCSQLDRVPDEVPGDQLLGVLAHGVPELLTAWTGGLTPTEPVGAQLLAFREHLGQVLLAAARDDLHTPANRLEPVFVLIAQTVTPTHLTAGLRALVDALLPAPDPDQPDEHDETCLRLRHLHGGGWQLDAHLDDETGQRLHDQLQATLRALTHQPDSDADADDIGRTVDDSDDSGDEVDADGHPVVHGQVVRSRAQSLVDALRALIDDAASVAAGTGRPHPAHLTVITTLPQLTGHLGHLPATLETPGPAHPVPTDTVRRLGRDGVLTAVLLDAAGNPVGASGEHRHATARERRALRAQWGSTCAVHGCPTTSTVPHHVEPWWLRHRTRLRDLVPICRHHHHDIHEGHRTLRLRDTRRITPTGWGEDQQAAA